MIESRQDTDFRTAFRIFIGCFNSLFFVPNFQPKFWEGDQIYLSRFGHLSTKQVYDSKGV